MFVARKLDVIDPQVGNLLEGMIRDRDDVAPLFLRRLRALGSAAFYIQPFQLRLDLHMIIGQRRARRQDKREKDEGGEGKNLHTAEIGKANMLVKRIASLGDFFRNVVRVSCAWRFRFS